LHGCGQISCRIRENLCAHFESFLSNIVISYLNLKSWVHRPEIS
jgi:hypothetical protein